MREQIEQRLEELRREYDAGTKLLSELETKQASVRATLSRISGAIQVLEEQAAGCRGVGLGASKAGASDGSLGESDALPPSVQ